MGNKICKKYFNNKFIAGCDSTTGQKLTCFIP